jgi:hypothetical protein
MGEALDALLVVWAAAAWVTAAALFIRWVVTRRAR